MSLTQDIANMVQAANNLTDEVAGKMGQIDQKVESAKQDFEDFKTQSDNRYALQKRITRTLRVDGDQNFWYPVRIGQPNGASFYLRRYTHDDSGVYGQWNGSLEFAFRGNDPEYGGNYRYILVDLYLVTGKSSSRILPDADIPFIGKLSANHSPYDIWVWLRGNTTYQFGADFAGISTEVFYEEFATPAGYANVTPIAFADGVDPSVPSVGYIRGEVAAS
ncbi:hypothetical protein RQZ06_003325 [Vibrio cholerae]|nr:hypothetical protein [Vibrio cholerae]